MELEKAILGIDGSTDSLAWADAHLNLGNALSARLESDRAANARRAIDCFNIALHSYEHLPNSDERCGLVHLALARVYASGVLDEQHTGRIHAVESAERAMALLPRTLWPEKWADASCILAGCLQDNADVDSLRQALTLLLAAAEVCDRYRAPADWAKIQTNLGGAYWALYKVGEGHFDDALNAYRNALELYTHDRHPQRWSSLQYNLGLLHASASDGDSASCKVAQEHFRLALQVRDIESNPAAHLDVQSALGKMHFKRGQWKEAHDAFECAIAAGNTLVERSFTSAGKRFEVGTTGDIFAMNAFCLIECGQFEAAFITLEKGRTRLLSQALALAGADAKELPEHERKEFLAARQSLREMQQSIDGRIDESQPIGLSSDSLQIAQEHLNQVIAEIRARFPTFLHFELPIATMFSLAPVTGAFVAFFVTPKGGGAFVIPGNTTSLRPAHLLRLDLLTSGKVHELLFGSSAESADGWFRYYPSIAARSDEQAWQTSLDHLCSELWKIAIEPLFERLLALGIAENAPVIIMPQGRLGLLPLHAAWRLLDGQKRYLGIVMK